MFDTMKGNCWHCGQALQGPDYAREGVCPGCQKPTHVCRNCDFYASSAPGACREPVADHVADKTRANFCGYFQAASQAGQGGADADALRQAADDLFDL